MDKHLDELERLINEFKFEVVDWENSGCDEISGISMGKAKQAILDYIKENYKKNEDLGK